MAEPDAQDINAQDIHAQEIQDPVVDALSGMMDSNLYASLVSRINSFAGEPNRFNFWLQSIEKVKRLLGNSEKFTLRAALQTTEGYIAEFIQRYIDEHPEGTWDELKESLKTQFGLSLDPMSALLRIRSAQQGHYMSYQMFGEEILSLVPQAFPDSNATDPLVQRELVNAFTAGVMCNKVRDKLVRTMPATLQASIELANSEQRIQDRVRMYNQTRTYQQVQYDDPRQFRHRVEGRYEEPMDCNMTKFRYTEDGRPICSYCRKVGHIWRECRSRLARNNQPRVTGHNEHSDRTDARQSSYRSNQRSNHRPNQRSEQQANTRDQQRSGGTSQQVNATSQTQAQVQQPEQQHLN